MRHLQKPTHDRTRRNGRGLPGGDRTGCHADSEERDIRTCPVCEHEVDREDMYFTKDCHGIPFRLVCDRCYQRIMSKGYDGEYYTEADEQIEDDY